MLSRLLCPWGKQRQRKAEKERFNRYIERLEKVIRDALDKKIKNDDYKTEIGTIEHFLEKDLLTERQRERVQEILKRFVV